MGQDEETLGGIELFENFPAPDLKALAKRCLWRRYTTDQQIVGISDPGGAPLPRGPRGPPLPFCDGIGISSVVHAIGACWRDPIDPAKDEGTPEGHCFLARAYRHWIPPGVRRQNLSDRRCSKLRDYPAHLVCHSSCSCPGDIFHSAAAVDVFRPYAYADDPCRIPLQ